MKTVINKQDGFTLIELMISLTLTVILLTGIFGILFTSLKSWQTGGSRTELQQTARYAMDSMVRDLRFASNYTLENDQSVIFIDQKEGGTQGNTIKYYVSSSNHVLYRHNVTTSTPQPVTGKPNNNTILVNAAGQPLFTLQDPNTLLITLTVTDTLTNQSMTLQTAVVSITQLIK